MKKKVNIFPVIPVYTIYPPIVSAKKNYEMKTGDILNCLLARAKVVEVLDSGEQVNLNLKNYNKDNSKEKKDKEEEDEAHKEKVNSVMNEYLGKKEEKPIPKETSSPSVTTTSVNKEKK